MPDEKCSHVWGYEYNMYESDIDIYSEHELHQAIYNCETPGPGAQAVYVNNFCPDCGKQLVK